MKYPIWVFNNSCQPDDRPNRVWKIPCNATKPRPVDAITQNRTKIVLYGSSHVRELYNHLVRVHRGDAFDSLLEKNVTRLRNGIFSMTCDPNRTGFLGGKYGVDLAACRKPGKRMAVEVGKNVAIGFKTFLHTPEADSLFLDFLQENDMSEPNVLVTDLGLWGPRGNRTSNVTNYTLTREQELEYNVAWYRKAFPANKTRVVLILDDEKYLEHSGMGGLARSRALEWYQQDEGVTILRKDLIMKQIGPDMRCAHGCAGPVMMIVAHMFLDWLTRAQRRCLL